MRPLRCFGALVILTSIHPSTDPITKVQRMLTGMNHLHQPPIKEKKQKRKKEGNYYSTYNKIKSKKN